MDSKVKRRLPWMDLDDRLVQSGPERREDDGLITVGRRSFLKALGISGVVSLTACERLKTENALPLNEPDEDYNPGVPVHYASTCTACAAGCGMMVTVRDGRPIKLEGLPEHPLSQGGLCSLGQASVRGLYDAGRLSAPKIDGAQVTWQQVDEKVQAGLAALGGKPAVVLTRTSNSPTARKTIAAFVAKHGGLHVEWDPGTTAGSAVQQAYAALDGKAAYPSLAINKADLLLTVGADLLGTGPEPVTHTSQYADRRRSRKVGATFRHLHVEGSLSLTGADADVRVQATATERSLIVGHLLAAVAKAEPAHEASSRALSLTAGLADIGAHAAKVETIAAELLRHKGAALVVSGSHEPGEQVLVALLNRILGAEGRTLGLKEPSAAQRGRDDAMAKLLADLAAGKIGALFVMDVDPVEQLPDGAKVAQQIAALPLSVALTSRPTATADACQVVAAAHHDLERWGDAQPRPEILTLVQPTVRNLFQTRDPMESIVRWSGVDKDYRTQLMDTWRAEVAADVKAFDTFWSESLSRGTVEAWRAAKAFGGDAEAEQAPTPNEAAAKTLVAALQPSKPAQLEVELFEELGTRDGRGTFNPWLRELPDPLTRCSWVGTVRLAPALAQGQKIADGDLVRVTVGQASVTMPARIVPGQHPQVIGVPLGYGIKDGDGGDGSSDRNGYRLAQASASGRKVAGLEASLVRIGKGKDLPLIQWHASTEGRPILFQVEGQDEAIPAGHHMEHSLWGDDHQYSPHWHMVIDLDACTGCSACVVACQAENNIPIVGPQNIADHRDMYWLRIDRYFDGDPNEPEVMFQPMLCSQCDNAPCETVCPPGATMHSHDGLNMQVYNRCVGTRYCANNCPYKVRRFNWFDFQPSDPVERMVLNPDVVVRARGVMEKCTFCVQRIQYARIDNKKRGDTTSIPDVQTACQQSCPAKAIHFGDAEQSPDVSVSRHEPRAFQALADVGVRPSITYLARVRRRKGEGEGS